VLRFLRARMESSTDFTRAAFLRAVSMDITRPPGSPATTCPSVPGSVARVRAVRMPTLTTPVPERGGVP
jgi:hypothetical protein